MESAKKKLVTVRKVKQLLDNKEGLAELFSNPLAEGTIEVVKFLTENKDMAAALKGKFTTRKRWN